ncbi:MAG: FtsX-like permease family protein [Roseivirga sp.]|nr:FtsX-like permease family protein [Roseivirga sp.]
MLRSFLKIALRNYRKQKLYHLINFTGLTIGLSCCALVVLYVQHESSYDSFHHNPEDTYRFAGKRVYGPWIPSMEIQYTQELMKHPFPGMTNMVRISRTPSKYSTVGNQKFNTNKTLILEPGSRFFNLFDFKLLQGNPESLVSAPNTAILTASLAEKYFPGQGAVGQTFKFDSLLVKVTGVIEDLPTNTHLEFEQLIVHPTYLDRSNGSSIFYSNINRNTNADLVADKIQQLNLGLNEYDSLAAIKAQPLESIHLNSKMTFELKKGGNKTQLFIFSLIALIILVISVTNYTNLSSALYSKRSNEIAMRKVLGSSKGQLSFQFMFESVLIACLCLPVVIFIIESLLPEFNNFIGIELENKFVSDPVSILLLVSIAVLTGVLGGIYPSFVLPQLKILNLFRRESKSLRGGLLMRRVMITTQFTLLIGLGAMAYFTNKQLQFMANKDLGFEAEGVIKIKQAWALQGADNIRNLKNRLMENPSISGVSQGYVPGDEDYTMNYQPEGSEVAYSDALSAGTDHDYFQVLDIEGLEGPYFSEASNEHPRSSLLVNEALVRKLGWDNPIGKRINTRPDSPEPRYHEIRGVFKDYNFFSLHQDVTPMLLFARDNREYVNQNILVKVNAVNMAAMLDYISNVWDEFVPEGPVRFELMETDIQKAYQNDAHTAKLSIILSALAIGLAVLGLVGLTAYISELKTKEVGIRKVLGAPLLSLLMIFNKEFLPSLLIATGLAGVVGYYAVSQWLGSFAYRIHVDLLTFAGAGIAVLFVTVLTVSLQSARTAAKNPVVALRHE